MSQISNNLLEKLKSVEENIKLKTINGKVDLKVLTLKQQKDLLSTGVTGLKGAISFNKVLNNIILDNADKEEIYTVDRSKITLYLRRQSLGSKVKIGEDTCDIDNYISRIDEVKKDFKLEDVVTEGKITLKLKVPTLKEENAIINRCLVELGKNKDDEKADKAFGVIYLYELIKYIESVGVGEEVVLFDDLKVAERVSVVENLPLAVYKQLSTFFKAITTYQNEILTFEEKTISIDPTFFDTVN